MRDLTAQQSAFVVAFTNEPGAIGNMSEAARRAGYSHKSAGEIGRQLLEKPHVKAAIDAANRAQIGSSLATKAVGVLQQLIDDETVPAKVRLDAAKTILDRSGYSPTRREEPEDPAEKELNDLSIEELTAIVDEEMERRAAAKAEAQRLRAV